MKAIFCMFVVIATLVISGQSYKNEPQTCTKNDVYTDCGPSCEKGCPGIGNSCEEYTEQCVPGCFCKTDEFRLPDGICGPFFECPQIQPTMPPPPERPETGYGA